MAISNSFHTSGKGHSISGAGKLSSVQRHNERGYFSFEYDANKIHALVGEPRNIVSDVRDYIDKKFQPAIDEYNEKQKRADRKINKSPFEYFCDNKKLDIANETIFQLGDKDFWAAVRIETIIKRNNKERVLKDFPDEVKAVMDEIYLRQAKAYEEIYNTDSEEILNRIEKDYVFSKHTLAQFEPSELEEFKKLEKKKQHDRKPFLDNFSFEKLERFEDFLSATTTVDFVENKRLLERIRAGAMTIKLTNLTSHYDEFSPHAHGISVCSIKGFENGINERVAKAVVLNKWSLSVLQDKMREIALEEMAKHPDLFPVSLAEKRKGRNLDYTAEEYIARQQQKKIDSANKEIEIKTAEVSSLRAQGEKLYSAVAELSELKTVAEYNKQVQLNDEDLETLEDRLQTVSEKVKNAGCSEGERQSIMQSVLYALAGLIENLRAQINRVLLFERLRKKLHLSEGQRQQDTLQGIIDNAFERSGPTGTGQQKTIDELEK